MIVISDPPLFEPIEIEDNHVEFHVVLAQVAAVLGRYRGAVRGDLLMGTKVQDVEQDGIDYKERIVVFIYRWEHNRWQLVFPIGGPS